MCKSPRAEARFFSFFLFSQKKKIQEQQEKLLNWSGQTVPAWLHLFGLGFLSSFQLCQVTQVINSKSNIFGVNVGIWGFKALDLTTFSKSKSLFFLNLKQNLLFIFIFLVRNTVAEVLVNKLKTGLTVPVSCFSVKPVTFPVFPFFPSFSVFNHNRIGLRSDSQLNRPVRSGF